MKKALVFVLMISLAAVLFAQQRYALVIGNNNYTNIQRLANPVNDATDIAAKLRTLGFQVDLQTNITNVQMARVISGFVNRLAQNRDSEGFFWFAGHGVQINGENYLLPVDVNSENEIEAVHSSYSVRRLVDSLDQIARNKVNVVVLDACRDNPFANMPGGFRNVARGLSVIPNMPSDLLVIYSTAPGSVAADGQAGQRNSPFTQAFLQGMDSNDDIQMVFRSIARETMRLTNNSQRPFHDGSFLNLDFYSLNPQGNQIRPSVQPPPVVATQPPPQTTPAPQAPPATQVPPQPEPSVRTSATPPQRPVSDGIVRINGGTFTMGSPANEVGRQSNESPQRRVTLSPFFMGKYPVTVGEFRRFVNATGYRTDAEKSGSGSVFTGGRWESKSDANWRNPYFTQGDNHPVVLVSWNDAVAYCNWLSRHEGLTPAYTINGNNVTWNRGANGYRLPTEAEWEYACRAGTTTVFNTGNNITTNQANYDGNHPYNNNARGEYRRRTTPVGSFAANAWGLHDMHGNVWEWCWDWMGAYPNTAQTNPAGPASGTGRMLRGGSWHNYGMGLRSAVRNSGSQPLRFSSMGFRIARN